MRFLIHGFVVVSVWAVWMSLSACMTPKEATNEIATTRTPKVLQQKRAYLLDSITPTLAPTLPTVQPTPTPPMSTHTPVTTPTLENVSANQTVFPVLEMPDWGTPDLPIVRLRDSETLVQLLPETQMQPDGTLAYRTVSPDGINWFPENELEVPAITHTLTLPESWSCTPESPLSAYRVGIQVGHWNTSTQPDEKAHLRTSYGTRAYNTTEVQINFITAWQIAAVLKAHGITVDILSAVLPTDYTADVFLSIHADGATPLDQHPQRGWKMSAPAYSSPANDYLLQTLKETYASQVDLPSDNTRITDAMLLHNSLNRYRYRDAIAITTPGVIVEMAYLSHPLDRAYLTENHPLIAEALSQGVLRFLCEADLSNIVERTARTQQILQVADTVPVTVPLYSSPNTQGAVIDTLANSQEMLVLEQQGTWYRVLVRNTWGIGWVYAQPGVLLPR